MTNAACELTIVMPCLSESQTLATCIHKGLRAIRRLQICGEVLVADNGSDDGSQDIARDFGARVVHVERKDYGSALRGGIFWFEYASRTQSHQ